MYLPKEIKYKLMEYKIENNEIHVLIPALNKGKFRFKIRNNNFEFGNSFATRSKIFNDKVYLEWQIGYDATIPEIKKGKKNTKLTNMTFVGYNKKIKHPYELSELLYEAIKTALIDVKVLIKLGEELDEYKEYLSDKKIDIQHHGSFTLNKVIFKETSVRLPTFFLSNLTDGTQIEVSIEKQQYATGVQPMLYFCIPLLSFLNGKKFYSKSSERGDKLIYVINKSNAIVLLDTFKVFGMASPAHHHDIREIIKTLLSIVKND